MGIKLLIRLVLMLVLILMLSSYGYSACTGSSPTWTTTPDYPSVASCVSEATGGDTITVSSDTATWDSTLIIDKAITLIGSGSPRITRGSLLSDSAIINISLPSDVSVRVSGFYFDNVHNDGTSKHAILVSGKKDGSFGLTKIRIDHCTFNRGKRAIYFAGWVYGLIDSNQFINCDIAVGLTGDDNYSWSRSMEAGTANSAFIEDNTFTANNDAEVNLNQQVYHQGGARSVIRKNIFDLSAVTAYTVSFIDSHGNQGTCASPLNMFRGQPILEIYDNVLKGGSYLKLDSNQFIDLRSGSSLVYNNDFYLTSGTARAITLWEEEGWTSGGTFDTPPCLSTWPAEDQINNTFFWNLRTYWNGTSTPTTLTDIGYNSNHTDTDAIFIQKDRDYFMHAPNATGGNETLADNGSPYYKRTNTMEFSSGQQAYYYYTPYTYPHPLRVQKFTGNVMIGGAGLFN